MAPQEQRDENNFLMDLENWVLEHRWDARIGIPCGPQRHLDHLWGQVMEEEIADYYPRRTYKEYCEWVLSGGGDEWFQPEVDPAQGMPEPLQHRRMVLARCPSCLRHDTMCNCASVNGRSELATDLQRIRAAGG